MRHAIFDYLARDHDRLDAIFREATAREEAIDLDAFARFRAGLLRHIGIEEKILMPAARRARGGRNIDAFERLRADHARLTALMVPTPTPAIAKVLHEILAPHNAIEEAEGGVYDECALLAGGEADELLVKMQATREPPLRPWFDGRLPKLLEKDG